MEIEVTSAGEFPRVEWVQQLPTENNIESSSSRVLIIGGTIVGAVIGFFVYGFGAALIGAGLGFLLAIKTVGDMWNEMSEKSKRQALKPLPVDCHCDAEVSKSDTDELIFTCAWTVDGEKRQGFTIPLLGFDSFVSGLSTDWFTPVDDAADTYPLLIISINSEERGLLPVAEHMGSRAEMAQLHAVLTREFITKRREFIPKQARTRTTSNKAAPATAPRKDVPRSDIPTAL